jgi:hypothetical protein
MLAFNEFVVLTLFKAFKMKRWLHLWQNCAISSDVERKQARYSVTQQAAVLFSIDHPPDCNINDLLERARQK